MNDAASQDVRSPVEPPLPADFDIEKFLRAYREGMRLAAHQRVTR